MYFLCTSYHILPSLCLTSSETSLHCTSLCIQSTVLYSLFLTIYSAFYLALGISCYSNILPSVLPFPNDMPSTWPYFRFRLILVVYSLYTFVCSVPSNIAHFAFPTLSLVSPFLYFPLFYLPILTSCFSLFTLSLLALPSLTFQYCPPFRPPFLHCPLFGPPFTDCPPVFTFLC